MPCILNVSIIYLVKNFEGRVTIVDDIVMRDFGMSTFLVLMELFLFQITICAPSIVSFPRNLPSNRNNVIVKYTSPKLPASAQISKIFGYKVVLSTVSENNVA